MPEAEIIHTLLTLIGGLLALLTGIVGWVDVRIHARLDEINRTLGEIDKDIRHEIAALDNRVTKIEVLYSKAAS